MPRDKSNGAKVREITAYEILDFSAMIVKASIWPVSRALLIKVTAFWIITPINFVADYRRFRESSASVC